MAGKTYTFSVNTPGHPFYFSTSAVGNNNATENIGVAGTPIENGTFTFRVPKNLPQPLYYQCAIHEYMGGKVVLICKSENKKCECNGDSDCVYKCKGQLGCCAVCHNNKCKTGSLTAEGCLVKHHKYGYYKQHN